MQQIDITRIHPSVKEVIADIVYSGDDFRLDIQTFEIHHVRHQTDGEKPTHYYVVIKFRDPEETPATCILSYSEVYDYASRTASSYDKSNNCFTRGPWKEYFDRMAILYAIRKAYIPRTKSTRAMLIIETKYEPANLLFVDLFSEYIVRYLCAKIKFLFYR